MRSGLTRSSARSFSRSLAAARSLRGRLPARLRSMLLRSVLPGIGAASARYLTKSSISPECPGRESCKAAPADAAEKIAFRIGRVLRMAAGLVIEIRRDDEALLRQKPCADGAGKERHRFAQRRLRRSCLPEHGSVKVAHRALDETAHFRD